jgi:hypothetical protein
MGGLYEGYRTLKLGTWNFQEPLHTLQTFNSNWLYGVQMSASTTKRKEETSDCY